MRLNGTNPSLSKQQNYGFLGGLLLLGGQQRSRRPLIPAWRFERFGWLRSYVRPLSVRSICPRALMKSDDRDPYQPRELFADDNRRVVPGLRWRPCRSSRLVALAKLEPVSLLCEPSLRRRAASLRLREHLGAETFTGLHHRPEDPGELVGQRHRNQPRRLLRQQANNPVAQGAFALAHYV